MLARKLSPARWQAINPVLDLLLELAEPVMLYYTWRPFSPDPGDDLLIDCAWHAHALIVTYNLKDFREVERRLGIKVLTPLQFVAQLALTAAQP